MPKDDVWLARWNTLRNYVVDQQNKYHDTDEPELLTCKEILNLMNQIEKLGEWSESDE